VNAGQWVYFDLPNGRNGSNWKLLDPTGHQIFFTSTYPQGAWQMLMTGTYTLSVIPSFSSFSPYTPSSFTFDAVSVTPSSPVAITLDQPVSAAITTPGAVDLFTFNGVAGQQVYSKRSAADNSHSSGNSQAPAVNRFSRTTSLVALHL